MSGRPAVFLDRDGTLNEEVNYLTRTEDLRLLPGAAEAVVRLRRAGYAAVVVTNQSVVARGMISEAGLEEIHRELRRRLAQAGAGLDGIYACPHHPDCGSPPYRITCGCRKPRPGLLLRAAGELGLDLARSTMVGDKQGDLEAGWNAGCQAALVLTGYGEKTRAKAGSEVLSRIACIAGDLSGVADWLLRQAR